MSDADLMNGLFELLGAAVLWQNVEKVRVDKMLRGIDWRVTAFFSTWGLWNLYYYPSLDQWASFVGGLAIVAVNIVWLSYAWKYRNA